jgi:hypothetical protein
LGGQDKQVSTATAPVTVENLPAAHEVHCEAAAAEKPPALQVWQVKLEVAPVTLEAVPAAQSMQDMAAPSVYVPGVHCWINICSPAEATTTVPVGRELFASSAFKTDA